MGEFANQSYWYRTNLMKPAEELHPPQTIFCRKWLTHTYHDDTISLANFYLLKRITLDLPSNPLVLLMIFTTTMISKALVHFTYAEYVLDRPKVRKLDINNRPISIRGAFRITRNRE